MLDEIDVPNLSVAAKDIRRQVPARVYSVWRITWLWQYPMEDFYNLMRKLYVPSKYAGTILWKVGEMLN